MFKPIQTAHGFVLTVIVRDDKHYLQIRVADRESEIELTDDERLDLACLLTEDIATLENKEYNDLKTGNKKE